MKYLVLMNMHRGYDFHQIGIIESDNQEEAMKIAMKKIDLDGDSYFSDDIANLYNDYEYESPEEFIKDKIYIYPIGDRVAMPPAILESVMNCKWNDN